MATIAARVRSRLSRIRYMSGVHLRHRHRYLALVEGKCGLEIGGPSDVFRSGNPLDLYEHIGGLDNCNFSDNTIWEGKQEPSYHYHPNKAVGRNFFCEGSDLSTITNGSYDFVLSSHNLEHLANPVKALTEWHRILRASGALILVLPDHRKTFDHRRKPTSVEHMMENFEHGTSEDNLEHLPEILEAHDLSRDPGAGTRAEFVERSIHNIANRCLHHHVFDTNNSRDLLNRSGFRVRSVDVADPCHILLLATRVER